MIYYGICTVGNLSKPYILYCFYSVQGTWTVIIMKPLKSLETTLSSFTWTMEEGEDIYIFVTYQS